MEVLAAVFAASTVVIGGIYLFTFTKRGKRWLDNL